MELFKGPPSHVKKNCIFQSRFKTFPINMDMYTKKAVFSHLKKYDHIANDDDFIEVTEWKNEEGFDVDIVGKSPTRFQLTWGEYAALKKVIKKLNEN